MPLNVSGGWSVAPIEFRFSAGGSYELAVEFLTKEEWRQQVEARVQGIISTTAAVKLSYSDAIKLCTVLAYRIALWKQTHVARTHARKSRAPALVHNTCPFLQYS